MLGPSGSTPCRVCAECVSVERVRFALVNAPLALYIISLGLGWLSLPVAVGILTTLVLVGALLLIYWVPLTSSPELDSDGNPRMK